MANRKPRTPEQRAAHSAAMKAKWVDPQFRLRNRKGQEAAGNPMHDPEVKDRHKQGCLEGWDGNDTRKTEQKERMEKVWEENPILREVQRERAHAQNKSRLVITID